MFQKFSHRLSCFDRKRHTSKKLTKLTNIIPTLILTSRGPLPWSLRINRGETTLKRSYVPYPHNFIQPYTTNRKTRRETHTICTLPSQAHIMPAHTRHPQSALCHNSGPAERDLQTHINS